jgi:hypothetical protein
VKQTSRVKATAYLVTGAWSFAIFIAGLNVPGLLLKLLSVLPVAIVAGFALFDYWLWAKGPIPRLTRNPDLRGLWEGTLTSTRDDGAGNIVEHDPIPIFLVIDQTYLSLEICLMSAESSSRSFAEVLQRNGGHSYSAYYHYSNTPKLRFRRWSPIHAGASRIEVAGLQPAVLSGEYWTDRETHGFYDVTRTSHPQAYSWDDALRATNTEREDD